MGRRVPLVLFWTEGSSQLCQRSFGDFWLLVPALTYTSLLSDCVSSLVFFWVCVCLCVFIWGGVHIYICMSFKHLGDYLLSRMFGNFKGKMERITESDYCLAT